MDRRVLDAIATERRYAQASSMSSSFQVQVSGSVSASESGTIVMQRSPLRMQGQVQETISGQTLQVNFIADKNAMYLRSDTIDPTAAKPWIRVPFGPGGPLAQTQATLQDENPMLLTAILQASKRPRYAGQEYVDGVLASKYTASASVSDMPAGVSELMGGQASPIHGAVHFTLWIAQDNVLKMLATEQVSGATATLSYNLNWINRQVDIGLPTDYMTVYQQGGVIGPT